MTTPTPTPSVLVRSEIERFLRSSDPEVLCISGAWGVGKTFMWKSVLKATAKSEKKPSKQNYSYVSLFGVDSLEELRKAIFSNQESLTQDPEEQASRKELAKSFVQRWWPKVFSKAKGAQSALEDIPWVGFLFKALGGMYFSSIRNMIICIDDLERRSKELKVKDVLGLISYLKEERNCKVVLLLNDGELGEEREDFDSYFEKTIDVHLHFAPTPEESAAIAFANPTTTEQRVRQHCVDFGITNIRIIRKIQRSAKGIQPLLTGYDQLVIDSAERSIVMLSWSLFKGTDAPSIEHLKERSGLTIFKFDKDKEAALSEEQQRWNNFLDNVKWGGLDELDTELISSIQAGYFDPIRIKAAADILQAKVIHEKQDGQFEASWKPYHESFDNNPDEVMDGMYAAFKKTYKTISLMNMDGTIRLFRDLGRNEQADELLKFYIDNRDEPQEFWDLDNHAFGGHVVDKQVRQAIKDKYKSFGNTEMSMGDLLEAMGGTKRGWQDKTVEEIAKLPVADYVALFRAERGDRMRRIVKGGLLANRSGNPTGAMKTVAVKTMEALVEIAKDSPLNTRRMESLFEIKIKPKAPDAPEQQAPENPPN